MQPDRDIEFTRRCLDAGIDTAPLILQFHPIQCLRNGLPFYGVDCVLRNRDGALLSPTFVRHEARRSSALRARSGELERWLLERCLQLASAPDATGVVPRLCFWLTPAAGYDALVSHLLSLERCDPPALVVVGIPMPSHMAATDACLAVALATRQAGFQISLGWNPLVDCDAEILTDLRPAYVEVPAESLLSVEALQARDWVEVMHAVGAEVIATRTETSQQLANLFALEIDYFSGPLLGADSTQMNFDFGGN